MTLLSHGIRLFTLPLLGIAAGTVCAEPRLRLAQAQIQIPSDAQLDRMERQGIVTPPLDDGRGASGGIVAEDRQMDEQAHRIDEKLLGGGICGGC